MSHAALAKPIDRLLGGQLSTLALAVGTIAPDLEFFIRGRIARTAGHQPYGVLLLDVPLALVFLAALTWLVVPGIIALLNDDALHLGPALRRSFTVPRRVWTDPTALAGHVLAVMIGAGSHILWDEFTHGPVAEGEAIAWLNRFPFAIGQADFALYSVLHWLSTAGGLASVMIVLNRWLDRQPRQIPAEALLEPVPSAIRNAGLAFVALVTIGFTIQNPIAVLGGGSARPDALGDLLATSATWALSGCFIALALFGGAIQLGLIERWEERRPGPNTPVG